MYTRVELRHSSFVAACAGDLRQFCRMGQVDARQVRVAPCTRGRASHEWTRKPRGINNDWSAVFALASASPAHQALGIPRRISGGLNRKSEPRALPGLGHRQGWHHTERRDPAEESNAEKGYGRHGMRIVEPCRAIAQRGQLATGIDRREIVRARAGFPSPARSRVGLDGVVSGRGTCLALRKGIELEECSRW